MKAHNWMRPHVRLYPNQILAVKNDDRLYDMFALTDAIRVGKVREQKKALELLKISFSL